MKNLKCYYPCDPKSPFYSKDWIDQLHEQYINPLKALGFTLVGTVSTEDPNQQCGTHILQFKHDEETELRAHWISDICNYQEEGFASQGFNYFGTLIITIIYSY